MDEGKEAPDSIAEELKEARAEAEELVGEEAVRQGKTKDQLLREVHPPGMPPSPKQSERFLIEAPDRINVDINIDAIHREEAQRRIRDSQGVIIIKRKPSEKSAEPTPPSNSE